MAVQSEFDVHRKVLMRSTYLLSPCLQTSPPSLVCVYWHTCTHRPGVLIILIIFQVSRQLMSNLNRSPLVLRARRAGSPPMYLYCLWCEGEVARKYLFLPLTASHSSTPGLVFKSHGEMMGGANTALHPVSRNSAANAYDVCAMSCIIRCVCILPT